MSEMTLAWRRWWSSGSGRMVSPRVAFFAGWIAAQTITEQKKR
jgi:hypothetical protein